MQVRLHVDLTKHAKKFAVGNLSGVEVFRVGTWNGQLYSSKDLDNMIEAFDKVGFQPPVKLGHYMDSGAPASGWVANPRRAGNKLVVDFEDVPEGILEAIDERRYDAVSIEIYHDVTVNGKPYARVIKAVALLGADVPAVAGLKPLRQTLQSQKSMQGDHGSYTVHSLNTRTHTMSKAKKDLKGLNVDQLKERRGEIRSEIAALRADDDEDKAEKIFALQETLDTVVDAIDTAQTAALVNADPVGTNALLERVADMERQLADTRSESRVSKIKALTESFSIPALRTHIATLVEMAHSIHEKGDTVMFAMKDGKKAATNPVSVVEDFVKRLDELAKKKLFTEAATSADNTKVEAEEISDDDAAKIYSNPTSVGKEIDRRAKDLCAKEGSLKYNDAVKRVLDGDTKLKTAYAAL